MPRYTWSQKKPKSRKKLISKNTAKKQKGGSVPPIPVFVSQDKKVLDSLLDINAELMISGIIKDGNGPKPANFVIKNISLDTGELPDFETCISIFRNVMAQLICSSPSVYTMPDNVKDDNKYSQIWKYIQPDKSANDKLPSAITDYNSLIQFIRVMRDFLIDPSDSKKKGRIWSSSISPELVNYITGPLRHAVFTICSVKPSTQLSTPSAKTFSSTSPSETIPSGGWPHTQLLNMPQGTIGAMPIDINNIQSIEGQLKELGIDNVTPKMLKLAKRVFWLGKRFLPKETAKDIKQMIELFSQKSELTTENIREVLSKTGYATSLPEYEINEIKAIHDTPDDKITAEAVAAEVLPESHNVEHPSTEPEEPPTEQPSSEPVPEEQPAEPSTETQPEQPSTESQAQEQAEPEPNQEPEPNPEPQQAEPQQAEPNQEPEPQQAEPQQAEPQEAEPQGGGARFKKHTYRKKTLKINKRKTKMPRGTTLNRRAPKHF